MDIYVTTISEIKQDILAYIPFLNKTRQEKTIKYLSFESKLQSLFMGLLFRYAYNSISTKTPWEEIDIVYAPNGKPFFAAPVNIQISNSHSKQLCAVCFDSYPVGIDVQFLKDTDSNIVDRFFAESEIELYHSAPKSQQKNLFYHMWCMKEACSKIEGDGIPMGFKRFIYINESEAYDTTLNAKINIHFYNISEDYLCCVASAHTNTFPDEPQIINPELLFPS